MPTSPEGPVWRVEELGGHDNRVVSAARPPLNVRFHQGRVEGFSGCNRLAGSYSLDARKLRLGPLAGTMMMCGEEAMALENAFRRVLSGTVAWSLANGRLALTSEAGATARLYQAPPPRLEGVTWEVTGYNNGREAVVSPILGTALTFSFAEGAVSGSAGCNTFRATYRAEGDRIDIGPAAATRKHCAGEGVMEQERAFLAALEAAKVWTVRDDLLDMHFEGGETRALTARPQ
jgi:heat shock protein HslJ